MVCTTQTPSQIKSQEINGHIKERIITTSPLTYVTIGIKYFIKCCIKRWVHLHLRPDNMLFGGLQPKGVLYFSLHVCIVLCIVSIFNSALFTRGISSDSVCTRIISSCVLFARGKSSCALH